MGSLGGLLEDTRSSRPKPETRNKKRFKEYMGSLKLKLGGSKAKALQRERKP